MPSSGEHGGRRGLVLALGVVVLIAAGVAGALIANDVNSPSSATTTTSPTAGSSCNATSIAAQVLPSVVTIFAGSGTSSGVGSPELVHSEIRPMLFSYSPLNMFSAVKLVPITASVR
jgi:hypothetical protein